DSIDGLSPAISIEQKTTSRNPRSTVGTVTEIYDYLRLLFARLGTPYCPETGIKLISQTKEQIFNELKKLNGFKAMILSPIIIAKKGTYEKLFETYKKKGYTKVRVNGIIYDIDETPELERYKKHNIDIIIDRLKLNSDTRLFEAVESSLKLSDGIVYIIFEDTTVKTNAEKIKLEDGKIQLNFSTHLYCAKLNKSYRKLEPRDFSFNSPYGACEHCHGLGSNVEFDPDLIINDDEKSIAHGGIEIIKTQNGGDNYLATLISNVAKHYDIDLSIPIREMSSKNLDILLYGTGEVIKFKYTTKAKGHDFHWTKKWDGLIPRLNEKIQSDESGERKIERYNKYIRDVSCGFCSGKRLKSQVLFQKISNKNIMDVCDMPIEEFQKWFDELNFNKNEEIFNPLQKEIKSRIGFLVNVGLGYLNLSRNAGTLSGGEAQRIRLATQIGTHLMGCMYILDEPSIGLHQKDNNKLISTMLQLRDIGNTIIVVEHDADTILNADYVIDIGPGAGVHGGQIIVAGSPSEIIKSKNSLTGKYLSGSMDIDKKDSIRESDGFIEINGACKFNLKNIDIKIPTHVMNCITGVSGSGKSTLMGDILIDGIKQCFLRRKPKSKWFKSFVNNSDVDKLIIIDQSPIGRTPRSNPATYIKVFDDIRLLFSSTKDSKMNGYGPGRFSFNVRGGRCSNCEGDGMIKIEMNFLPDVYVQCDQCKGKRYNEKTLEIKYKDKNIADILNMSVEESVSFFENVPNIHRKLKTLSDVGLDYIKLGQSATTLSGGEAQRIKLTRELAKRKLGHTLYILDEPTTGLHFDDVKKLLEVLNSLVDKNNTMVIIEHNLDVIKNCDHIIDLGPDGGARGGEVIIQGTPEFIAKSGVGYTSKYLKKEMKKN
ncbi:excinuclease ABC subunit UvrA, partial [Candidatus Woesearchaeota archaeon]|nr:excinuclease ABC subunit UvrA [Candidatus Woesearchaeota archaeon]